MTFPDNLLYTSDHEWVLIEGTVATVGITGYATDQLGDIVYVEIGTEGQTLNAHDVFGTVEAVKTVADLFMPVAGKVIEVNKLLDSQPELVNQDPYGSAWIVKVEMTAPHSGLLSPDEYRKHVGA